MNTDIMIFIIICCVLICIVCNDSNFSEYYSNERNMSLYNDRSIPRILWTYWDKEDMIPGMVKLCQENWKKIAPNYKINFITQKNINRWVKMPENWKSLPAYRQADILRLLLIYNYGGVWIDSSTILLKNPDKFISPNNITLFITPGSTLNDPVFENWFISAPPHHRIIKLWASEVLLAISNKSSYINKSPDHHKKVVKNSDYLICHLVLKNIYERDRNLFRNIKIYESKETAFFYHEKYNWENLPKNLLKDKYDPDKLIVKFRGWDRHGIDMEALEKKMDKIN